MKSLSLLAHTIGSTDGQPDTLTEIARHFDTIWGTAIAPLGNNTFLQSDAEGNLYVLSHDIKGFSADDRRRLRITSEILLGEMVNRIRPITLLQPSANAIVIPKAFLATVEGSIYVFAEIVPEWQDFLMRLQAKMAEILRSPGGVGFAKYRGVKTQVRDMGEEGPGRFVDGEVVEGFLDLSEGLQKEIVEGLGGDVEWERLRTIVEGLRRVR